MDEGDSGEVEQVGIVSWYDEGFSNIGDLSTLVTSRYCDTHGYGLEVSHDVKAPHRVRNWEKLPAVIAALNLYNIVVWVDADAFFRVDAPALDGLLRKYNTDVILSEDAPWTGDNPGGTDINSGAFVIRNTAWARGFLDKWYTDEDLYKRRIRPWHDQGVLRVMYDEDEEVRNHCSMSPLGELQSFGLGSGLIAHYTDCVARGKRHDKIKSYVSRLNEKNTIKKSQ